MQKRHDFQALWAQVREGERERGREGERERGREGERERGRDREERQRA
jgi:hypothetical protein